MSRDGYVDFSGRYKYVCEYHHHKILSLRLLYSKILLFLFRLPLRDLLCTPVTIFILLVLCKSSAIIYCLFFYKSSQNIYFYLTASIQFGWYAIIIIKAIFVITIRSTFFALLLINFSMTLCSTLVLFTLYFKYSDQGN